MPGSLCTGRASHRTQASRTPPLGQWSQAQLEAKGGSPADWGPHRVLAACRAQAAASAEASRAGLADPMLHAGPGTPSAIPTRADSEVRVGGTHPLLSGHGIPGPSVLLLWAPPSQARAAEWCPGSPHSSLRDGSRDQGQSAAVHTVMGPQRHGHDCWLTPGATLRVELHEALGQRLWTPAGGKPAPLLCCELLPDPSTQCNRPRHGSSQAFWDRHPLGQTGAAPSPGMLSHPAHIT